MSDELEDIKKILNEDSAVKPRKEAKEKAIFAAMQAFDQLQEKTAAVRQGTSAGSRLTRKTNGFIEAILEGLNMKKTFVFAGSACVALVALLLVSQQQTSDIRLVNCADGTTSCIEAPPIPTKQPETGQPGKKVEPAVLSGEISSEAEAPDSNDGAKVARTEAAEPLKQQPAPAVLTPEGRPSREEQYAVAIGGEKDREVVAKPTSIPLLEKSKSDKREQNFAIASGAAPEPLFRRDQSVVSGAAPSTLADYVGSPLNHYQDFGRDKFENVKSNSIKIAKTDPVSTLSVDVDTASYSFVRGALMNQGVLPQKDAVRIEELVNYFPYDYSGPESKKEPFKASVSVYPSPWNEGKKIMHIGIRGFKLEQSESPKANLVFLIDTSGSMNSSDKLPLLINSLKMLVDNLRADDTISIVTYAGSAGTALQPTKVSERAKILSALDNLSSGGSTAGAEGIRQAYQLAEQNFDKNGVNRVILATDGDFNVGITDPNELKSFIERKRETGVSLSVLGFGRGNYNDALMQKLAQNGNGNAAYIDSLNEARKVLVEEAGSTLFTIAKDVKIQVEFNPATVAEYRLIGYETRLLNREDFNNDKIDAGDIGAGHTVTALYEITPIDSKAKLVDDLRYQAAATEKSASQAASGEYAFVKIRYKLPNEDTSKLITTAVDSKSEYKQLGDVPTEARFATAVASFGQLLRGDSFTGKFGYEDVISLADGAKGSDKFGYRAEFINLARIAKSASTLETQPR